MTLFAALLLLIVGIILLLVGIGFALNFLSNMIRNVGMTWTQMLIVVAIATIGIVFGLWLVFEHAHILVSH